MSGAASRFSRAGMLTPSPTPSPAASPRTKQEYFAAPRVSWNPTEALCIINPDRHGLTCTGWAPSKGRRCQIGINQANSARAFRMLSEMKHEAPDADELEDVLLDLAEATLCVRYHQDQADTVVRKWQTALRNLKPSQPALVKAEDGKLRAQLESAEATIRSLKSQNATLRDASSSLAAEHAAAIDAARTHLAGYERAQAELQAERARRLRAEAAPPAPSPDALAKAAAQQAESVRLAALDADLCSQRRDLAAQQQALGREKAVAAAQQRAAAQAQREARSALNTAQLEQKRAAAEAARAHGRVAALQAEVRRAQVVRAALERETAWTRAAAEKALRDQHRAFVDLLGRFGAKADEWKGRAKEGQGWGFLFKGCKIVKVLPAAELAGLPSTPDKVPAVGRVQVEGFGLTAAALEIRVAGKNMGTVVSEAGEPPRRDEGIKAVRRVQTVA